MDTLGKRIAQLRREKGIKQEELAEKLGVTPQAVSKWENDISCPDISLLPELAQVLGTTTDELLTGEREPETKVLPQEKRKDIKDMIMRIVVESRAGDKVKVNLPMAMVQAALESGMEIPNFSGMEALKGIDLAEIFEFARKGVIGNLVEVESSGGDIVKIFVE